MAITRLHAVTIMGALVACLSNATAATINGTAGPDDLWGTPTEDEIRSLGGSDIVRGRGGQDRIYAGEGRDTIYGGSSAEDASDDNRDDIDCGPGNDTAYGNGGADFIFGGPGNDRLQGNAGNDHIYGGSGSGDSTETGADEIRGGKGVDYLYGNGGDDSIYGGEADDVLKGGFGKDYLEGGPGIDSLAGGVGPDTFRYLAPDLADGAERIEDFSIVQGDVMDIENIDADVQAAGDQDFTRFEVITGTGFPACGVLRRLVRVKASSAGLDLRFCTGGTSANITLIGKNDISDFSLEWFVQE